MEDLRIAGLEVGVVGSFADGDASVVDEDVELSIVVPDAGFGCFDAFFAGDVEVDEMDVFGRDSYFFELL